MGTTLDNIARFKFYAHKVLPLVYDESLSYYEFLCKVLAKLNEVIDNENAQNDYLVHRLTDDAIYKAFEEYIEENPSVVTFVANNSITEPKIEENFLAQILNSNIEIIDNNDIDDVIANI